MSVMTTADSPCEVADVACNLGFHSVLAAVVLAVLCCCASCCVVPGALWYWRRTRVYGQRYIAAIGQKCKYRCEARVENEVLKRHVRWQLDPKVLSKFYSSGLDHRDLEGTVEFHEHEAELGQDALDRSPGHAPDARSGDLDDTELFSIAMATGPTTLGRRSSSLISSGSSSSSYVPTSDRLVLRGGRHLSRDSYDENPVPSVLPAYAHKSHVEYYSCTYHRWLRAVVTLDALDRHVDGTQRLAEVVYGVHLSRTQQFRNHVPLYHLRRPVEAGHVVEVSTGPGSSWRPARVQKIALGKTERFFVVKVGTEQLTVPLSSTRRCFPLGSQVFRAGMCVCASLSVSDSSASFETRRRTPRTSGRRDSGQITQVSFQLRVSSQMFLGRVYVCLCVRPKETTLLLLRAVRRCVAHPTLSLSSVWDHKLRP